VSYLRSPFYVWSDGSTTHIWAREQTESYAEYVKDCDFPAGVGLPNDVFDALCLMRVAEIDAAHNRRKYERTALEKFGGNFGSAALYRRLGMTPPWERSDA
jgi:hypothetical protein